MWQESSQGGWQSLCGLQASRDTHGAGRRDLRDPVRRVAMVSMWDGGGRGSPHGRRGTGKGREEPTARGILRSPSRGRGKGSG